MPKIDVMLKAARAVMEGDCAGPPAGPRVKRAVEEKVAQFRAERQHAAADHMSFLNADGSRSRICICTCSRCWPDDGRPCPDWTDDAEDV